MINGSTVFAVIPARRDSKRLPKKNILSLANKPLIMWTIEAGLGSKYIDKVVVSSNDSQILKLSKESGTDILERPEEISNDDSSSYSAVEHAIRTIEVEYDYTILLQPTSPLRTSQHIDEAFEILIDKNADSVVSVCEDEHCPLWSNTLSKDLNMKNFIIDDIKNKRSQDLPKYYRLNGAIYIAKTKQLLYEKTFFIKDKIFAYKMLQENSIDIDTIFDFKLAEIILSFEKVLV